MNIYLKSKMSRNYSYLCFTLIIVGIFSLSVHSQPAIENGKFFGKYKIPAETSQPINIDTSKANRVFTKPLILIGHTQDKFNITNTGNSLELLLAQENTRSRLEAFNGVYKFHKKVYYWNANGTGTTGTTVNGVNGTPLEIIAYFFNEAYGSFENSRYHRDGMVGVSFRIAVENYVSNPLFPLYGANLRQVREPNTSSATTLGTALGWYSIFPPNTFYYAYPGSYKDRETGKEYFCSTTIILPHYPNMVLSKQQYDSTFRAVKISGDSRAPQSPADEIPIVVGRDLHQILIPNRSK